MENPTAGFGIPGRGDRQTRDDRERYDALNDQDSAGRAQRVSRVGPGFQANKLGVRASQRIEWRLLWRERLAGPRIPSRVGHLRWPLPWHGGRWKFFPQHLLRSLGPSRAARIGVQVIERNSVRRSPAGAADRPSGPLKASEICHPTLMACETVFDDSGAFQGGLRNRGRRLGSRFTPFAICRGAASAGA